MEHLFINFQINFRVVGLVSMFLLDCSSNIISNFNAKMPGKSLSNGLGFLIEFVKLLSTLLSNKIFP